MRKPILSALIIMVLAGLLAVFYLADTMLTDLPEKKWAAWNETLPICKQFCKDNGGEYKNHEIVWEFGEKMLPNSVNCECKGIGSKCLGNFCYDGFNEIYKLRRQR